MTLLFCKISREILSKSIAGLTVCWNKFTPSSGWFLAKKYPDSSPFVVIQNDTHRNRLTVAIFNLRTHEACYVIYTSNPWEPGHYKLLFHFRICLPKEFVLNIVWFEKL